MAQIESYNPERSLAEGGRSRRERIMAEGTSGPGTEGPKLYIPPNKSGVPAGEYSIRPPQPARVERRSMPDSSFKQVLKSISTLEQQPLSPERDTRLQEARETRNKMLREANEQGWFNSVKEELFELYYDSRVKVDRDEKLGTKEWRKQGGGPGRLELLRTLERSAIRDSWEGNWADEDYGRQGFWSDPDRVALQGRYGGVVDYFQEQSLKMIRAVVTHRYMYEREGLDDVISKSRLMAADQYQNNGLTLLDQDGYSVWNYTWHSDHERTYYLKNFDDVRDTVEHERRKKYFIPNRGDYESWIKLVADDVEEVEECIPYMLSFVKSKFGTGEPKKIFQEIDQERTKIQKALEKFGYDLGYERELPEYRKFRRLQSKVAHEIKLLQTHEFSDLAYLDWEPYLESGGDLARGFHDTEYQDSIPDSILLDRDGLMMLALQEFERNDGEYWRYGSNSANTPKSLKVGNAREWQERRKNEIKETLVNKELRSMYDLLNMDKDGRPLGNPAHPAFQRLKVKFDALDEKDRQASRPLVGSYGKPMTRWQEYCEKALAWQKNQILTEVITVNGRRVERRVYPIGDVRDYSQRVLFQHPLARALSEEELGLMYQDVDRNSVAFKRGLVEKEHKINSIVGSVDSVGTAERVARAFQEDAAAGLARHLVSFAQMQTIGLIPLDTPLDVNGRLNIVLDSDGYPLDSSNHRIPREILHYALSLDGKPILENGKLIPEAVPHKVLLRQLCQLAMNHDWQGVEVDVGKQKRMRFKLSYVLNRIGIPHTLPLFSNWYLGAHDTIRPNWLADIETALPGFKQLMRDKNKVRSLDPDDEFGGDEKTILTRAVEDEREFVEVMEMYIRDQFPSYFNYPGHDTRGGGNKEARNLLLLPYGQSRGTVEMNSIIPHIWLGETDFLSSYGCSNWREFIGIYKGSDEVVYKEIGSLFETPRDAEYWFRRVKAIIDQQRRWISETDKGPAVLNGGWGSGFFLWRGLNRTASFIERGRHMIAGPGGRNLPVNQFTSLYYPEEAYAQLDERTYESYVKLAFQFLTPLISIFEARQKLENVYGRSPGTAKFLNTLTWYAVSRWMDTNYEEFRGKYGNALDPNLPLARKFIHNALYESRLIFSDEQFDQRMLGYTIPKAEWDRIINGPYYDHQDSTLSPEDLARKRRITWSDLTDEQKEQYKPIIKVISYKLDSQGRTIAAGDIIDHNENVVVKEGAVVEGEQVVGILDAFPRDLRKRILDRHNTAGSNQILPFGLKSDYPETLGTIRQLEKRERGSNMGKIYQRLLRPDQSKERITKQTKERITVTRAV